MESSRRKYGLNRHCTIDAADACHKVRTKNDDLKGKRPQEQSEVTAPDPRLRLR